MSRFGIIPPEPSAIASLSGLAPLFRGKVEQLLNRFSDGVVRESLRTDKRQQWLWGFGRLYDDDRGIVTNAKTCRTSWHFYGLAVDIVHKSLGDDAPGAFWSELVRHAHELGLVNGVDFLPSGRFGPDRPHIQWGAPMRHSPSSHAYALYLTGGFQAVWKAVGAV